MTILAIANYQVKKTLFIIGRIRSQFFSIAGYPPNNLQIHDIKKIRMGD